MQMCKKCVNLKKLLIQKKIKPLLKLKSKLCKRKNKNEKKTRDFFLFIY